MTPSDRLYNALQDHYQTCRVCTPQADCPTGHDLLMAWGAQDAKESAGWWLPQAERAAVRGEPYLADPGERTDA